MNSLPAWLAGKLAKAVGADHLDIVDVRALPGHSGVGFSFGVAQEMPGLPPRLVARFAPENVPSSGPADVVRQALIMDSLASEGLPVPSIVCHGVSTGDEGGRGFFVAAFVDGGQIGKTLPPPTADVALARRGVEALADLHDADWRPHALVWGDAITVPVELDRLARLYHRPTIDPHSGGRLDILAGKLGASLPAGDCGFVHGDYHWGNVIFRDGEVRAIVDWEIAMLGPRLIDIGWLAFYSDPLSFLPDEESPLSGMVLSPEEMIDTYRARRRARILDRDIAWYRAFAAYRYGVITCFNEMLHRRGKRDDPMWESIIKSVPQMAERGLEILSSHSSA